MEATVCCRPSTIFFFRSAAGHLGVLLRCSGISANCGFSTYANASRRLVSDFFSDYPTLLGNRRHRVLDASNVRDPVLSASWYNMYIWHWLWESPVCTIDSFSVLTLIEQYSFIVSPDICQYKSPALFFKITLGILGPSYFYINFTISLSIYTHIHIHTQTAGIFYWDSTKSLDQLGENWHFQIMYFLTHV